MQPQYVLRPYQQAAVDLAMDWVKANTEPCLLELAPGAGKSLIVADIARQLFDISGGKRVLCLQPSADLTKQNYSKYKLTGNHASIYSASISKSLRHPVIYATPGSFKKVAKQLGGQFTGVIIDEAHSTTKTIKKIIDDMRESNPYLRVIGLTGTPFRLGEGYIYDITQENKVVDETQKRNPYYKKLLYSITTPELIKMGFLTPPVIGAINANAYDTSQLELNNMGNFTSQSVDRAFVGHGRKTAAIVGDIVDQSQDKKGVMIFAATVDHAKEILASLPPAFSDMIGGDTNMKAAERKRLLTRFQKQEFKYLVSVETLTTGVDFPHVDVVALLRATESHTLFYQIIGRGARLYDGKESFLLLDYANNVERLFPDGDIYAPEIRATKGEESTLYTVKCELCGGDNEVSLRKNEEGYDIDEYGYFIDLDGNRIETDDGPIPAHYGRRCSAVRLLGHNRIEQCDYYWTYKECEACGGKNDIAARRCGDCGEELIDPNDKLVGEFKALKRNPALLQTDEVVNWDAKHSISRAGNEMITVKFKTPYRMIRAFYMKNHQSKFLQKRTDDLLQATNNLDNPPRTITYQKDMKSGMWNVLDYNQPTDEEKLEWKQNELKQRRTAANTAAVHM